MQWNITYNATEWSLLSKKTDVKFIIISGKETLLKKLSLILIVIYYYSRLFSDS